MLYFSKRTKILMKKFLKLIIFYLCSLSFSFAQQVTIPNGDFEYWDGGMFPTGWENNSCPMCMPPWETWVIRPDSINVYSGNYSIKLLYSNGPLWHWTLPPWAKIKFPIQNKPLSLNAYVKTEMYVPDPVKIDVFLYFNNNIVDNGFWQVDSAINDWTHIIIPISNNSPNADSAQIVLTGGIEVFDTTLANDTKFWVDNLSFNYITSSEDYFLNSQIYIYPNPATDVIQINLPNNKISEVKIYNVLGKLVKQEILNHKNEIDVSELNGGVYFVKITTDKQEFVSKFIKR